jgi:hypothetical protein
MFGCTDTPAEPANFPAPAAIREAAGASRMAFWLQPESLPAEKLAAGKLSELSDSSRKACGRQAFLAFRLQPEIY